MLKVRKEKLHRLIGFEFIFKSYGSSRIHKIVSFNKKNFSIETKEGLKTWYQNGSEETINRLIKNGDIIEEKR